MKNKCVSIFLKLFFVFCSVSFSQENQAKQSEIAYSDAEKKVYIKPYINTSIERDEFDESESSDGFNSNLELNLELISYELAFLKLDAVNDILSEVGLPTLKSTSHGFSPKIGLTFYNISLFYSHSRLKNVKFKILDEITYSLISNKIELRYSFNIIDYFSFYPSVEFSHSYDILTYENIVDYQENGLVNSEKVFIEGAKNMYINPSLGVEYYFGAEESPNKFVVVGIKYTYFLGLSVKDHPYEDLFSSDLSGSSVINFYTRFDLTF